MPSKLLNLGKKVWQEDDAVPDKETLSQAWNRLTKTQLSTLKKVDWINCGDTYYELMPNDYIIENYSGSHAIYEPGLDIEKTKVKIEELEEKIEDLKQWLRGDDD